MWHTSRISTATLAAVAIATTLLALAWRHRHRDLPAGPLPAAFSTAMPQRVVWAWEQPEDLRALPPAVGVAYLAETLLLGDQVEVLARRQPLRPAPGASLMAVVRIETRPGFLDTPALRADVARRLAALANRGDARALQIDFDATGSERPFYAGLLRDLRPSLPAGTPLSITALVSWCGRGSWIHGLPIDEAVPMFFRMGGPRRSTAAAGTLPWAITEPLCRTSAGVATDEPWPRRVQDAGPARVYIFAPAPWQPRQLAAVAADPLIHLEKELVR